MKAQRHAVPRLSRAEPYRSTNRWIQPGAPPLGPALLGGGGAVDPGTPPALCSAAHAASSRCPSRSAARRLRLARVRAAPLEPGSPSADPPRLAATPLLIPPTAAAPRAAPAPPPPPPPPAEPVELKTRSVEMVVGGFFLGLAGAATLTGGLTYATEPGGDKKAVEIGGVGRGRGRHHPRLRARARDGRRQAGAERPAMGRCLRSGWAWAR